MKDVTFITGNQNKADYLAKYLGHPVRHQKVDLEEIQSLDLQQIVRHKVRQAYDIVKVPVIVEDVALEFKAFNRLPGPFIKFFLEDLGTQGVCDLLKDKDRGATGICLFGYYDGTTEQYFKGSIDGTITETPQGDNGFGWDPIFIPDGYGRTRAELDPEDYQEVYLKIRPFAALKAFLASR